MILVKVPNQSFIQDKPGRSPRSFIGTVALPVHKVLEATAPTTTVQEAIDCLGVNHTGRWGGFRSGTQGVTVGLRRET